MAEEWVDGTGTGKKAKVNVRNRVAVSAANYSESRLIAAQDANTFLWTTSASQATGSYAIYIQNTSTTHRLIIDKVTCSSVLTGFFELYQVSGTASGTVITGKNSNLTSGNPAAATSFGGVSGLTDAGRLDHMRLPALGRATMELQDIVILGANDAIAVKYTGGTDTVDIIITGYYKPISELK